MVCLSPHMGACTTLKGVFLTNTSKFNTMYTICKSEASYFPLCENRRTKQPFRPAVRLSDGQFGIRHCWPGSRHHRDGSRTLVWLPTPAMSSKSTVSSYRSSFSYTVHISNVIMPTYQQSSGLPSWTLGPFHWLIVHYHFYFQFFFC